MTEPTLTDLLRLVDEPTPDPTDVKDALRAELDDTLHHGRTAGRRPGPAAAGGRPPRPRLLIAAALLVVAGAAGVIAYAGGGDDATDTVIAPAGEDTTEPAAPSDPRPTTDTACAAFVADATPIDRLASFAAAPAATSPAPETAGTDLEATATALEELHRTLVEGNLVDDMTATTLELAAGAMRQASREFESGEIDSAAQSVDASIDELRSLDDDAAELSDACGWSDPGEG